MHLLVEHIHIEADVIFCPGDLVATNDFAFDALKPFDDNFESFLTELESIDEAMAAVLRANADLLTEVVHNGERDSNARAAFNVEIAKALDALVAPAVSDT